MKKLYLFFTLLVAVVFVACVDDSYDLDNFSDDVFVPIEQVFPVGSSEVSVKDLLSELDLEGLDEDADGLIYFQYDTVSTFDLNSFVFDLEGDTSLLEFGGDFSGVEWSDVVVDQEFPMVARLPIRFADESGEGRIDSAELTSALLEFELITNIPGLLDILDMEVVLPANLHAQSSSFRWDKERSVGRLALDAVWLDLMDSDTLLFDCLFRLDGTLPLSRIGEDSYVGIVSSSVDLKYKRLYGLFKAHTTQIDTSVMAIDFYEEDGVDYSLSLVDPSLEIKAWTNSGVPINVGIERLIARNCLGAWESARYADGASKYTLMMRPAVEEGEEVLGLHEVFNAKNGNIDRLINSSPDTVEVSTSFFVDGKESRSGGSYFLLDSTYVRVGITTMVPIWMNAGSFITLSDTIKDLDFYQDIVDYENENFEVEEATLFLEVENGLPLAVQVDFFFLAEDTLRLPSGDSLITLSEIENEKFRQNVKLDASLLDVDRHIALKPTKNMVKIQADNTMLDDMKRIRHIVVRYKVQVPLASSSTKVYSHNIIKAKAYVHAKGNYSSK